MAIAFVQVVGAAGENVTAIATANITTTAGNLLHVDHTRWSGGGGSPVITDNKSNTWLVGNAEVSFSAVTISQNYAKDCLGGASHTFTCTLAAAGYPTLVVTEISGCDATAPKDQNNAAAISGVTSKSSGSITTTVADEILCGAGSAGASGQMPFVNDGDYTQRFMQPTTANFQGLITGTRIVSSTETNDYVAAATNAGDLSAGVVSYKISAAAPTGRIFALAGSGGGLIGEPKGLAG